MKILIVALSCLLLLSCCVEDKTQVAWEKKIPEYIKAEQTMSVGNYMPEILKVSSELKESNTEHQIYRVGAIIPYYVRPQPGVFDVTIRNEDNVIIDIKNLAYK